MEGGRVGKCDKMLIVGEWVNLVEFYMRVCYKNFYIFL